MAHPSKDVAMFRSALLAVFSALLAFALPAHAVDGNLDDTFGTDATFPGYGFYLNPFGGGLDEHGYVLRAAPNGSLYLFGTVEDAPNTRRLSVLRATANGYPDYDFGNAGLRTYQPPCSNGFPSDVAIDAQGRMWVSFYTCDDFTVYRFTPAGDLDITLLGSGVLHIPFNLGDTNSDIAQRIALTPEGDLVVAGMVAATPFKRLGVAVYTANGQPKPGFGIDGKVDLFANELINNVGGVHVMRDGRIVITGRYAPNLMAAVQTVVRLQTNGQVDAGFGNYAPGVSHADVGNLLGNGSKRLLSEGSLLESDGSVLQVGSGPFGGPNSDWDFGVLKWRPDGTLDTSVGPAGLRSYSLDFAGPNPADSADNFDRAYAIVRQSDGKYVVLGQSQAADGRSGISLIRLLPTLALDPGFGSGGKLRYLSAVAPAGSDCSLAVNPLIQGGRIIAGANLCIGNGLSVQAMVGMKNDLLFADGVE
jgi:uncharacterized delta-60 repeat protein